MILDLKEIAVLERLRIGWNYTQIAEDTKMSSYVVSNIANRLIEESAVQKLSNGRYKVLLDTYEQSDVPIDRKKSMEVFIPKGYEEFIRCHKGILPRSEIARRLKVDKFTVNMMIIQLGLEGKNSASRQEADN